MTGHDECLTKESLTLTRREKVDKAENWMKFAKLPIPIAGLQVRN